VRAGATLNELAALPEATAEPVIAADVHAQLERIISSSSFKSSKRHPRFLRFVIEKSLSGTAQEIKERIIGVEVFDRAVDYDLASDPIVRVAAGEIRKRLAQYYVQEGHDGELRFDLPPGSYVPHIYWPRPSEHAHRHELEQLAVVPPTFESEEPANAPSGSSQNDRSISEMPRTTSKVGIYRWSALAGVALILVAAAIWWFHAADRYRDLDVFWSPVFNGPSTLICVGDLNFLMNSTAPADDEQLEHLISVRNHVGPNDVVALARLAGMLGRKDRKFSVLLADNATLTDLRSQPAVLIGASDNRWTKRILENSRFQVQRDPVALVGSITDSRNPTQRDWLIDYKAGLSTIRRDFALVSRVSNPLTGQIDLVVAGVGPYGTAAASEFVTNPDYFRHFTARAPKDWQNKDIQIVLSTDVVDGRSGPPQVLLFDLR
jgi:hypothetical protein